MDPKAFDGLGDLVLTGKQKVAGELVLVVKGAYIAGVYPVKNTAVVRKVLADVLRRIR